MTAQLRNKKSAASKKHEKIQGSPDGSAWSANKWNERKSRVAKRGTGAAGAGGRICVKTDARQSWGKRNFFRLSG